MCVPRCKPNAESEALTDNRDAMACRCLLTTRKRNRHPAEGIPEWCPLPNARPHAPERSDDEEKSDE